MTGLRCPFALVGALGMMMAVPAFAEVTAYRFALTPFAGYRIGGEFEDDDTGDELDLDDGASLGLILNAPYDDRTEWEVFYGRQETDIDDATVPVDPNLDIVIEYLQIGGTYVGEGEAARPYLAATIGGSRIEPDGAGFDSETYFAFGIGGGLHVFPESRVGLRLEGRLFGSLVDSDSGVFCQSGPTGSRCLIRSSGDVFWQWDMFAGVTVRF
jgi:hypothetical protein